MIFILNVSVKSGKPQAGWLMVSTLHTSLLQSALKMAIYRGRPKPGFIHHSDRVIEYTSEDYRNQLDENRLIASMSLKGKSYDNAAMETFLSTPKYEQIFRYTFKTRDESK
jgi:putative transposase